MPARAEYHRFPTECAGETRHEEIDTPCRAKEQRHAPVEEGRLINVRPPEEMGHRVVAAFGNLARYLGMPDLPTAEAPLLAETWQEDHRSQQQQTQNMQRCPVVRPHYDSYASPAALRRQDATYALRRG